MDNSVTTPLKRHPLYNTDRRFSQYLYLFSALPAAASALIFFLPYYFIQALRFSVLQAGVLMSCYGIGIFAAILLTPYLNTQFSYKKMILFSLSANCIALAYFLSAHTFPLLSLNLLLLGFAGYCFKHNTSHWLLQLAKNEAHTQTKLLQQAYMGSNIGLGLAMLAIAFFALHNFTTLFVSAIILNAVPLFLGRTRESAPTLIRKSAPTRFTIFPLTLLFLGGLLLSQLTTTYGIYLSLKFPLVGLTAMAVFMFINVFLLSWLQKPLLAVFSRGSQLFYGGFGALLMGLGLYVGSLLHLFSLVVLSALIFSLGELFFIGNLHRLCPRGFQGTLALSLIIGASLGAYVYQFFGAAVLWQSCAYIGIACFVMCCIGLRYGQMGE